MKEYLQIGEQTNFKKFVLRCCEDSDLEELFRRLGKNKEDYKIKYETFSKKNMKQNHIEWGGFPELIINKPHPELIVKFGSQEDIENFYKNILQKPYKNERGIWFPEKRRSYSTKAYWTTKDKRINKYPLFVISKGRFQKERSKTINWFNKNHIKHFLVVEECEYNNYKERNLEYTTILSMPDTYNNLGKGSIPVRNWIDEYSRMNSYKKYWVIDDNINGFYRFHKNTRREVRSSILFRICEDFSDRCKNLYMSGLQYFSFLPEISRRRGLCIKNTRIYSCILIDTRLKYILDGTLWRGRYNEDTDLSLRLLKKGFPTILHQQFLCDKSTTNSVKGGNTSSIYMNDGLQKKLDSLIAQHEDCVKGTIKFGKVHHQVDYRKFKNNEIIYSKNKIIPSDHDEWGLEINEE